MEEIFFFTLNLNCIISRIENLLLIPCWVFVSFQDTGQLDNKILLKNGKIDSLKSYYPNGDEKFKVYFERNKIYHFINEEGRCDYNEIIQKWILN
jgi:antitoxin component YwqK of YwqJK toxin-antitoxin module